MAWILGKSNIDDETTENDAVISKIDTECHKPIPVQQIFYTVV